jgi:hypothetical protein
MKLFNLNATLCIKDVVSKQIWQQQSRLNDLKFEGLFETLVDREKINYRIDAIFTKEGLSSDSQEFEEFCKFYGIIIDYSECILNKNK